jgi:aminoglycoside 2'-N-acetyltransferase I
MIGSLAHLARHRHEMDHDGRVVDVHMVHTAHLDSAMRTAVRALLERELDDFTEQDWEHCLGGLHALAWEEERLVGHAAIVQRRLLHAGRAWRAGYVEGVAVRGDRRGRGYGSAVMDAVEQVARAAYELGALATTDAAASFYPARGWVPWRGRTAVLTPAAIERTPEDDGAVYVLPVTARLDVLGELICDWRDGDVW